MHFPLFSALVNPLLLIVETTGVFLGSRTHTIVDESDGILTGGQELRILSLVNRGARGLVCASCADHSMSKIGSMLLEAIRNIPDLLVVDQFAIGLKFAQVDQF